MRLHRTAALVAAGALGLAGLGATATAAPAVSASPAAAQQAAQGEATRYVVVARNGVSADTLAARLRAGGATVTHVNSAIGVLSVTSTAADFAASTRALDAVEGVSVDRVMGRAPVDMPDKNQIEKAAGAASVARGHVKKKPTPKADPMDDQLWGMTMMNVPQAHKVTLGDRRVRVGILDTGVQGDHPDLAPNFSNSLSRNFTVDDAALGDGETCETANCTDPANVDDNGHGTHVAGTIGAALNGMGVSGVAPKVTLVNIRGGQDSGYFLVGPVTQALTYAGDAGLDVVNMSFYVDPWLYNCIGGAPEDTPEQAAEQQAIITAVTRALNYAHKKGVTLVGALGNNHEDLSKPRVDTSSPDFPTDNPVARTIDNQKCFDLPVEGPHVIGVSSVGPSRTKADYSNYATDLRSGELEVAAPGGWYRDGFGTATYRTNGNLILSAAPLHVLQAEGSVDEAGEITEDGLALGVQKDCDSKGSCGYYQFLQGTSMASPHAAGVAALAVSAHGHPGAKHSFGWSPDRVKSLLMRTAQDTACPAGGVQSYTREGRSAEFDAACVGTAKFNSLYGDGILDAYRVVTAHGNSHR